MNVNRKAYGIGGEHIEGFREGWAVLPFVGGHAVPHYWKRRDLTHQFRALCGLASDQTAFHPGAQRQFAPGIFMVDRCKTCARKRDRQARRAA